MIALPARCKTKSPCPTPAAEIEPDDGKKDSPLPLLKDPLLALSSTITSSLPGPLFVFPIPDAEIASLLRNIFPMPMTAPVAVEERVEDHSAG